MSSSSPLRLSPTINSEKDSPKSKSCHKNEFVLQMFLPASQLKPIFGVFTHCGKHLHKSAKIYFLLKEIMSVSQIRNGGGTTTPLSFIKGRVYQDINYFLIFDHPFLTSVLPNEVAMEKHEFILTASFCVSICTCIPNISTFHIR